MASPPPPQQKKDQPSRPRLYSPYQDLNLPYSTLYHLPTNPDHLFPEDSTRTRRTWGENLTYYTGLFYLGGAVYGSAKGTLTGIRAFEEGDTRKLKINRVLNGAGEGGRGVGNRMGVIGLIYAGLESGVVAVRDVDDVVNGVIAGLGTGVVYRAANGVRAAAVAGAVGGVVAGVAMAGKRMLKRYVPI